MRSEYSIRQRAVGWELGFTSVLANFMAPNRTEIVLLGARSAHLLMRLHEGASFPA